MNKKLRVRWQSVPVSRKYFYLKQFTVIQFNCIFGPFRRRRQQFHFPIPSYCTRLSSHVRARGIALVIFYLELDHFDARSSTVTGARPTLVGTLTSSRHLQGGLQISQIW